MKRLSLLIVLLCYQVIGVSQTYSFKTISQYDHFEILTEGNRLVCLFRVSEKKAPVSVFRKVFLNDELHSTDSIEYSIDGQADLIASGSDEKYSFHAFYLKAAPQEKIVFIVTDKLGRVQSTFYKTVADFAPYFQKPVKKLKDVRLSFLPNNGSPGMILIQPYLVRGSAVYRGPMYSVRAEDGRELWASNAPFLSSIQCTDSLLIGMTSSTVNQTPIYQIHYVDKSSGKLLKTISLSNKGQHYRSVSVFTSNGRELLVAGSEFENGSTKNGRFFMSLFNLYGEKIFDEVDSAARLSTKRLHLMGSVFDQEGNLVLIGESWRPDATRAVVTSAASILLAATIGGYAGINTRVDHKIDNVVFATLSPQDGKLKYFRAYPVGPWRDYGSLMTEGGNVLFRINNQVIIYDVNDPGKPPSPFTSLRAGENLILTPSGPIINRQERNRNILSRLR